MKKCGFCEKEYEIFADHELINKGYDLLIPSQIDETKLGYDVYIEKLKTTKFKSVCLQYKIPEQYIRCPDKYESYCGKNPCRFFPHKDSKTGKYNQHNILVDINKSSTNELALYCLPKFFTHTELHDFLKLNKIFEHSKLLKPIHDFKDTENHIIVYGKKGAYQFSEEGQKVESISIEEVEIIFNQMEYQSYYDWKNRLLEIISTSIDNDLAHHNEVCNMNEKSFFKLLAQNNIRFMIKFEE